MFNRTQVIKLMNRGKAAINASMKFERTFKEISFVCKEIFYYPEQIWDMEDGLKFLGEEIERLIGLVDRLTKVGSDSQEFINLFVNTIPEQIRIINDYLKKQNKVLSMIKQGLKANIMDVLDRAKGDKKVLGVLSKFVL